MINFISFFAVLIILGVTILFTKKIFKNTSAEGSRKTIHVTIGVTTLFFPYLFNNFIPVVLLGIIAFATLLILRNVKSIHKKFGDGLFSVERESYGELYFVGAVVLIFTLYKTMNLNIVHYLIPIATLTFADSTAALIGVRYGTKKLSTEHEDTKSIEGSFIFFVVAFMCSLIPLQLMTNVGRLEVLLISAFVGILSAMIEMTSHSGNDNFSLPFFTFLIVQYNFTKNAADLMEIFVTVLFLVFVCSIINRSTSISKLAIVSALLYGYMTLILGSINWLYIPLLVFAFFSIIPQTTELEKKNVLNYRIIEYCILPGTIFVYIKSITGLIDICFVSFLISYCSCLCMNTYTRMHTFYNKSEKRSVWFAIFKTILVVEIPYILFNANHNVYRWWDWIILLTTIIISGYIAIPLNKKYDYSKINLCAARANSITASILGTVVLLGYLILGGIGCITLS